MESSFLLSRVSPPFRSYKRSMMMNYFTTCVLKPLPTPNRDLTSTPLPIPTLSPTSLPSKVSPWLMLPPVFKGGDMDCTLYDIDDGRLWNHYTRKDGGEFPPDDGVRLVGCSHGWVASYDENSSHVYLSNPISGRHIKLPPLNTLRDDYIISLRDFGHISREETFDPSKRVLPRVILSHPPDEEEEECRAMMSFGVGGRLAFCVPGVSTEWTLLGYNKFCEDNPLFEVRPHCDFVYCSRRKVFTSITDCQFRVDDFWFKFDDDYINFGHGQMLDWNILEPNYEVSADDDRVIIPDNIYYVKDEDGRHPVCSNDYVRMLRTECIQMVHLVRVEQLSAVPLTVLRFVNREMGYTTVFFLVLRCDDGDSTFSLVHDLEGLAFFIGMNHSFAIPAASAGLKPNSIYFSDAGRIDDALCYSDCGVFDYDKKIMSPFRNLNDFSPPMFWFTPSPSNA